VDFIRDRHRVPKINLMGICMGGSFSIMYSALHEETKIKKKNQPKNDPQDLDLLRARKMIGPTRAI